MENIIFIIGPISAGKSTIARLIKGSVIVEIDDIYGSNLDGRDFNQAYKNRRFQEVCWNQFYEKIRINKLRNKSVVALTTGLNPKFKSILKQLRKEFPKEVYIIKINSNKNNTILRTRRRRGTKQRKILDTLSTHEKFKERQIKADFVIENNQDLVNLRRKVRDILRLIES